MRLNYVTDIACNEDHQCNIFAIYSLADRISRVQILEARSVEDAVQLLASDAANDERFRVAGPALSRAMRTAALMKKVPA